MTPDEQQLRQQISEKERELRALQDDLTMMLDERERIMRRKRMPLGVDLSLLEDDGK